MCRPDDYPPHTADALLTADECEAIGLDPTGRDGNPRYPYRRRDYARQLDAARYAEAIAGARAMRHADAGARFAGLLWDQPRAHADERAYGIPVDDWPLYRSRYAFTVTDPRP